MMISIVAIFAAFVAVMLFIATSSLGNPEDI
jgi:hypothetical protein